MGISVQKITTTAKTAISIDSDSFVSMLFSSGDQTANSIVDIYVVDQNGSNVTTTGVYVNSASIASTPGTSTAVTVDNGSGGASGAANDAFLNERVYGSDGTFYGICTAVASSTSLTFGGGLVKSLANNTLLHVGNRFHLLKNAVIPVGTALSIGYDDFRFDNNNYNLYIKSDESIDIIINS